MESTDFDLVNGSTLDTLMGKQSGCCGDFFGPCTDTLVSSCSVHCTDGNRRETPMAPCFQNMFPT